MDEPQVIEHGESSSARWLRERRLRLALLIAFVESLLVLFSAHGWRYVIIAVILAVAAYWFVGRRRSGVVYEIPGWPPSPSSSRCSSPCSGCW